MSTLRSRVPFAAVLALAVGVGAYIGDPVAPAVPTPRASATAGVSAALASGNVRSAAWYCPIASPSRAVAAGDALTISNTGTKRIAVEIQGVSARRVVGRKRIEISGNNATRLTLEEFGVKSDLGVIVEAFGSGVVVEHNITVDQRETSTPCATEPGTRAYFGAATTRKNMQQTVALMNPFGQSAVIDIALLTSDGLLRPKSMQAIEVAARSKVWVSLNAGADQQSVLSVAATARSGRFVAESLLVGRGELATSPISLQIGVPSLATEWHLTDFDRQRSETHQLVIANPGETAIDVNVLTLRDNTVAVEQRIVKLEAGTTRVVSPTVDAEQRDDVSVIVNSQRPFAAGSMHESTARGQQGVSLGAPLSHSSTQWAFGVDHTALLDDSVWFSIENEATSDASVQIVGAAGGIRRNLDIPAQQRVAVKITGNTVVSVVTITSDQRIFVSRRMTGPGGISRSPGVPTL